MSKLWAIIISCLVASMFIGCGSGGSDTSGGTERHVLTQKDFWDDLTLKADLRNLVVVASRDVADYVELPNSCSGDCIALIPYLVENETTIILSWLLGDLDLQQHAIIYDNMDAEIIRIDEGGDAQSVTLLAGNYYLHIYREISDDRTPVFIRPDPDVEGHFFDAETTAYPDAMILSGDCCEGCNLSGGNLLQAILSGLSLDGSDLSGINMLGGDLSNSSLVGASLSGINLYIANVAGADLTSADLSGGNLFQANLDGATLDNAQMAGINMPEAGLSGASLDSADISGAILGFINAPNASFKNANLVGTVLTYSTLTEADFSDADLTFVDLTGADLTDAILDGANLSGATWTDGSICSEGSVGVCN